MSTIVRAALTASLVAVAAFLNGCGANVDGTQEPSASTSEALCPINSDTCGTTSNTTIQCDPSTMCCYQGQVSMMAIACSTKLYNAGCRSTNGDVYAQAVEKNSWLLGHYWFEVYCPTTAQYLASDSDCTTAGIRWSFAGNNCTVDTPPSGEVEVIYDPNCGGACGVIQ